MTSHDLAPGSVFAERYEIVGEPDARHDFTLLPVRRTDGLRPDRALTLLVVEQWLTDDAQMRERFVREMLRRDLSAFEGRVTTPIDGDVDDARRRAWMVFETPWGAPLSTLPPGKPLPLADARSALLALGATLVEMHELGVRNGDLSRENVWFGRSPGGVAVATQLVPGLRALVHDARSKNVGAVFAAPPMSLGHLAPEALMGKAEGPPADVWSFALLAFELLTGAPYWGTLREPAGSLHELAMEILTKPSPPASERAQGAPRPSALNRGFDEWFARCLQREPGDRPSMREAEEGLSALLEAPIPHVPLPVVPELIRGNPKGSFYDRGMDVTPTPPIPPWTDNGNPFRVGPPHVPPEPEIIRGNPKGSFYDRGLSEKPRLRWNVVLPYVIFGLFMGAVAAWTILKFRR